MAKKTTKKKTTTRKAAATKTAGTRKKTTKKKATTKKAAVKKSVTKKTATKKAAAKTTKKKTTKKTAAKKTSAGKKKTTKKTATQKAKTEPVEKPDASDNGKQAKADTTPTPPPIRRVVRPNPIESEQNQADHLTHLSESKLKRIKSGLTRKDLNHFKQLLLEKRAEIVGDVMGMEEARASGNGGDLSNMPLHMADIGSDNYEQEFTLGLVESERKLLMEIDQALLRIKKGIYGICLVTGKPIPRERLEIKPWAKYSIEVVREREKRGLHSF
ncbi:MAG: hypothetical protein Kow00105_02850 [Phycisphaeraceae bacterium]